MAQLLYDSRDDPYHERIGVNSSTGSTTSGLSRSARLTLPMLAESAARFTRRAQC